jgi:hypothetical protein
MPKRSHISMRKMVVNDRVWDAGAVFMGFSTLSDQVQDLSCLE